ncbi:hypothetical protein ACSBR1_002410 [Camellia fascicularis]
MGGLGFYWFQLFGVGNAVRVAAGVMWITGFCVGEGVNRTSIPVAFSQMDAFMMLMCCYQSTNVAYNPQLPHTYDKLVEFVCSKFKELTPGKLLFFYKIPGYNEFTLQNVVDMETMLCLARSFRLQIVDMVVKQNVGVNTWIQSNDQSVNETYSHSRLSVLDNLDMHDEVDLLQTFCPHNDKVFILESWACRFTHIGQHFEGGATEFRNVLRKYAVQCGFQFNYVKNDSVRITTICAMLNVHVRKLEANGFFYLYKWVSEHTCGVVVHTSTNRFVGSGLVIDIIAERIRDRPLIRPTEVILDMKQDYGLDITYRVTWLGVEKAKGELFGVHSISFDQL